MCKEYTYDLQIVFDGTEDAMYPTGFKSFFDNIEDVRADVLSQISINIYPVEEKAVTTVPSENQYKRKKSQSLLIDIIKELETPQ